MDFLLYITAVHEKGIHTSLPLGETVMCAGFLLSSLLEELVHFLLIQTRTRSRDASGKWAVKRTGNRNKVGDDTLLAMRKKTDGSASNSSGAEQSTRVELKDGATSHRPVEQQQQCEVSPPGGDGEQRQKSAIRTFFVVAALSFHSVVAGLSLSVEKETGGVWLNFAVICMHKFVIAFSMGAELVTATVSIQHP